jgi:hypothetical protein
MLSQVKYIDDIHIDAIDPDDEPTDFLEDELLEHKIADEKRFILSKFTKFDIFSAKRLFDYAADALQLMPSEDNEENLLKKKVKRHERKNKAFEKETFDVFDYDYDDELDNEEGTDENTKKILNKKM